MLIYSGDQSGNRKHILKRILWLRSLALLIAIAALLVFQFELERGLNYPVLYGVVMVAVAYTLASLVRLRSSLPVTDQELLIHLLMDALLVLVLVSLSGRATNPFIYYLLVLVAINATIFSRLISWLFASCAVFAYTVLLYFDLEQHIHHLFSEFQLHLIGMWLNFVGSTLLMNYFVSSLATSLRNREIRLAEAREKTLKNEQLIGIGTLAASTVHALGTPLSTMAVLLGEMRSEKASDREQVDVLMAQVDRCKTTMSKLSQLASDDQPAGELVLAELLVQLREHYLLANPAVKPQFEMAARTENSVIENHSSLLYAFINLIDNAIRAASAHVAVKIECEGARLLFSIEDDGAGMPSDLVENFGEPSLSRKQGGLGIGIYLANSTVENIGGKIVLFNPSESRTGKTTVVVELPLKEINDGH